MRFSIIMPCYLGYYKSAAKNRPEKLVRAVRSVLSQRFQDFELIIVADGCQETVDIITENFSKEGLEGKIRVFKIKKEHNFSGTPRNTGILNAKGDLICYLDADDIFLPDHLELIDKEFTGDWVWFDDSSYNSTHKRFDHHYTNIDRHAECGTSNICHSRSLDVFWDAKGGYARDDWKLICALKRRSENYSKISTIGYGICHVPNLLDY